MARADLACARQRTTLDPRVQRDYRLYRAVLDADEYQTRLDVLGILAAHDPPEASAAWQTVQQQDAKSEGRIMATFRAVSAVSD